MIKGKSQSAQVLQALIFGKRESNLGTQIEEDWAEDHVSSTIRQNLRQGSYVVITAQSCSGCSFYGRLDNVDWISVSLRGRRGSKSSIPKIIERGLTSVKPAWSSVSVCKGDPFEIVVVAITIYSRSKVIPVSSR